MSATKPTPVSTSLMVYIKLHDNDIQAIENAISSHKMQAGLKNLWVAKNDFHITLIAPTDIPVHMISQAENVIAGILKKFEQFPLGIASSLMDFSAKNNFAKLHFESPMMTRNGKTTTMIMHLQNELITALQQMGIQARPGATPPHITIAKNGSFNQPIAFNTAQQKHLKAIAESLKSHLFSKNTQISLTFKTKQADNRVITKIKQLSLKPTNASLSHSTFDNKNLEKNLDVKNLSDNFSNHNTADKERDAFEAEMMSTAKPSTQARKNKNAGGASTNYLTSHSNTTISNQTDTQSIFNVPPSNAKPVTGAELDAFEAEMMKLPPLRYPSNFFTTSAPSTNNSASNARNTSGDHEKSAKPRAGSSGSKRK